MIDLFKYPWLVLGVTLLSFWTAARIGVSIQKWRHSESEASRADFNLLIGATPASVTHIYLTVDIRQRLSDA